RSNKFQQLPTPFNAHASTHAPALWSEVRVSLGLSLKTVSCRWRQVLTATPVARIVATFVALVRTVHMTSPVTERLSRREREIMNVVFALDNRALAEQIRERL